MGESLGELWIKMKGKILCWHLMAGDPTWTALPINLWLVWLLYSVPFLLLHRPLGTLWDLSLHLSFNDFLFFFAPICDGTVLAFLLWDKSQLFLLRIVNELSCHHVLSLPLSVVLSSSNIRWFLWFSRILRWNCWMSDSLFYSSECRRHHWHCALLLLTAGSM